MSSAVGVLTCHQGVVRFGRGMALASAVLLAAMLTPTIGFADAIVYGDFTEEMMMEAQLQDQLLIELAIAWNPADIVAYDYSLDTATGAFGFSTATGQTVAGLPFSFASSAQLDGSTGDWSWIGSGVAGGVAFQIVGNGALIGDPETDITGTYTDANDKTYAATAKVTITESDTGASARKSDGTGEAKDANGTVVKSGKVKDVEVVNTSGGDRTWRIWFVDDLGGQGANDLGFARPVGGSVFQGQFTQTVAVPETGAWTMMLLGFAGVAFAGSQRAKSGRTVSSVA